MWFKRKRSVCETCPERCAPCLAGDCKLRYCVLCVWHKKVNFLKAITSVYGRHQCNEPSQSDPVTGKPDNSCDSARGVEYRCGKKGKLFMHKDQANVRVAEFG